MSPPVFHRSANILFRLGEAGVKWLALALLAPACISHAGSLLHGTPDNYLELLKQLSPGDTLLLQPGIYRHGLPLAYTEGRAGQPITISGPDSGPSPKFLARPGANTISIVDSGYITIRHLELDGQGLPSDAVKAEGHARWAHHITLDDLYIHGHGANQQTVGISSKCPAWGWIIRNNRIVGAGTGIYLGNSDGSAPFVDGLIEHNLIINTLGYNLQIKHQHARPALPGMPLARSSTVIRHNVFSKAENSSTGTHARPNVLIGHWPLQGTGSADAYLVHANLFYLNPHEALFQGEGNISLYNNLFINPAGNAISIQPHNDVPRRILVFHNTVLAGGHGIALTGGNAAFEQNITGNAVFSSRPIIADRQQDNLARPLEMAPAFLRNPFAPLGSADWSPLPGIPRPSGTIRTELDFDGMIRKSPAVGAYAGPLPRWLPRLEIKPRTSP